MGVRLGRWIFMVMVLLLTVSYGAEGRILRLNSFDDHLVSDGISGCNHQYGFLPCAENVKGYIFMILVYLVLLAFGDFLLGRWSEVLLIITGPHFGGILFRILKALPSMILLIFTGIFSDKETAQSQVSVAVRIYAGFTVFNLTLQWSKCTVSASKSLKKKSKKKKQQLGINETSSRSDCFPIKEKFRILIDNGVEVDQYTCETARIMVLSLVPYAVLQLVYLFTTPFAKRVIILIALALSSLSLISYIVYQMLNPRVQKRCLNYSKLEFTQKRFAEHVERLGELVKEGILRDIDLIRRFFYKADREYKQIAAEEFEKLVSDKEVDHNDGQHKSVNKSERTRINNEFDKIMWKEEIYDKMTLFNSICLVLLGSGLNVLGGPLTANMLELSNSLTYPSNIVTFAVVPVAMNFRTAIGILFPSSQKRKKTPSLTFSEIYGGVTMNNIVGLTTLLVIVYVKDLTWDFSAEVLTIMVVCGVIGVVASRRTTYYLWKCIPVLTIYLVSLLSFCFIP